MNESKQNEIRFKPQAAVISTDELALLESILPDLIQAMLLLHVEDERGTERRSPSQLHSA